mmetsp:Transcript_2420/g.5911  ORF Transcript_2420/g.5911 Transcript_2420/m.5911 type:complete len:208 (-) Transcript_2420:1099-1722(-)
MPVVLEELLHPVRHAHALALPRSRRDPAGHGVHLLSRLLEHARQRQPRQAVLHHVRPVEAVEAVGAHHACLLGRRRLVGARGHPVGGGPLPAQPLHRWRHVLLGVGVHRLQPARPARLDLLVEVERQEARARRRRCTGHTLARHGGKRLLVRRGELRLVRVPVEQREDSQRLAVVGGLRGHVLAQHCDVLRGRAVQHGLGPVLHTRL